MSRRLDEIFPCFGVRAISGQAERIEHWFWLEEHARTYLPQAEALHGAAEYVTRTGAQADAELSRRLSPMLRHAEEVHARLEQLRAAATSRIQRPT